jgi:hypothetical protein
VEALKLLERKVEDAIQREHDVVDGVFHTTPAFEAKLPAVVPLEKRSLYGFALPDEDVHLKVREQAKVVRRKEIDSYRAHATLLRQAMQKVGVEPIAVITAKAWNKIVADHGLYKVQPNTHGCVSIDTGLVSALRRCPAWAYALQVCTVLLVWGVLIRAFGAIAPNSLTSPETWPLPVILGAFVVAALGAFAIGYSSHLRATWVENKLVPWRVKKLVATHTHEQLLAMAAPERALYGNSYANTPITFPTPPSAVTGLLQSDLFGGKQGLIDGTTIPTLKVAARPGPFSSWAAGSMRSASKSSRPGRTRSGCVRTPSSTPSTGPPWPSWPSTALNWPSRSPPWMQW